jgi:thiamine pyrophosphokinase
MPQSALIICNGEPPSRTLAQRLASKADVIIAADGGANVARQIGIRPQVIIGDMDSITNATKRFYAPLMEGEGPKPLDLGGASNARCLRPKGRGYVHVIQVKRQDNTDLEKALDYLQSRGVGEVSIIGATGRRIDFTFGNVSVIWKYASRINIAFVGDGWTATPVQSGKKMKAKPGTTISLIPFGRCSGITLKGLRYPLTNATMKVGEIGVSNVVETSPFSITVRRGNMMMFMLPRS